MSYEVEIKEVIPQPIAAIHAVITIPKLPKKLPRFMIKILKYLNKNSIQIVGPPTAVYYHFSDTRGEVEVGIPIEQEISPKRNIKNSKLPGGKAAFVLYTGKYENISPAYDAIQDWIKKNGYEYTNIWWERYLTDPRQEPDQNKWQTEIYLLLEN